MKKTCFLSNVFNSIAKFSSQYAYIYHFLKILQPMRLFGPVRLFGTLKYSKPLTYSKDSIISTVSIKRTVRNSSLMTLLNVPYDLYVGSSID